jgi:hypothetical protein
MTDTPKNIRDLQLKIWLAKTPAQRLQQLMIDNEALLLFWAKVKPVVAKTDTKSKIND